MEGTVMTESASHDPRAQVPHYEHLVPKKLGNAVLAKFHFGCAEPEAKHSFGERCIPKKLGNEFSKQTA